MTRPTRLPPATALIRAPADTAGAGPSPDRVAEIVTFRLASTTSGAAFLDAARATGPLVASQPGFLARRLSRGTDGMWTDHVAWANLAAAEAAARDIMTDPRAAPFLAAIDPATLAMRHEALVWTLGDD